MRRPEDEEAIRPHLCKGPPIYVFLDCWICSLLHLIVICSRGLQFCGACAIVVLDKTCFVGFRLCTKPQFLPDIAGFYSNDYTTICARLEHTIPGVRHGESDVFLMAYTYAYHGHDTHSSHFDSFLDSQRLLCVPQSRAWRNTSHTSRLPQDQTPLRDLLARSPPSNLNPFALPAAQRILCRRRPAHQERKSTNRSRHSTTAPTIAEKR